MKEAKRQAYRKVARHIVDRCDLLIALWDGRPARGTGGTAEVVYHAETQGCPRIIISTTPPYDVVIEKERGLSTDTAQKIEKFNSWEITETENRAYVQNVHNRLFDNPEGAELAQNTKHLVREKLLPFYVRASKMGKSNQTLHSRTSCTAYLLSVSAIAAVALGILFHAFSFYASF